MGCTMIAFHLRGVLRITAGLSAGALAWGCAPQSPPRTALVEQVADSAVAVSRAAAALGDTSTIKYRVSRFERRDSVYLIELIPESSDPRIADLAGGLVMVYFDGRVEIVQRYR